MKSAITPQHNFTCIIHWEDMGSTEKSIKGIRNELAKRSTNELLLFKWSSNGQHTYGFLLVDFTLQEIVFTGNGFRIDGGGEGGRVAKKISDFLRIYGCAAPLCVDVPELYVHVPDDLNADTSHPLYEQFARDMVTHLRKAESWIFEEQPFRLSEKKPMY
jgi:hypothetical protein